ncbi:hypothetical protein RhiirA5_462055 [Rhizophagus irregularis]|uniref:HD1-like protein n=1 Tax=Rhizophagus irregularis TaxID=588596 RepID=A0A141TLI8_9GLOM|nr:HD1-like protein [Rhizophagus irregularis]AMM02523.1 HD1-like protein [Rhizophagus irregularis]AMM02524.1 HD1-like protein [Rhizophagus irregularis]AMM02530.1 HD1-like protein [Rhizophagus irregularis]AMM02532.1 HD1-like protein [Rhizophagus irregularis]
MQQSSQVQSFSTLQTHIFDPLINNDELEKNQQLINSQYDDILLNNFSQQNHKLNSLETNKSLKCITRFENHIMYPLLLNLLNYKDCLYYKDSTELLSRTEELSVELSKINDININTALDKDIRSCISTVTHQIIEICNEEVDFGNDLVEIRNDMIKIISLQKELSNSSSNFISFNNESSNFESGKSKNIRQNMDPMAVLWFIKYLIDHKLEKPNKKHRFLLSLWTNVPEHDIDRWFIRTMSNYVKKLNNAEKVREKLKERAINTTRQLRKPNSLKTNSESRQVIPQRNSPYKRPTRGRKEKIKQ